MQQNNQSRLTQIDTALYHMSSRSEGGQGPRMCLLAGSWTGISLETGQEAMRSPRVTRRPPGGIYNASILGLKEITVTAGTCHTIHNTDTNAHISASM